MTPSEYKLIGFLQRINKKYIREKKLNDVTLKQFCKIVLSDPSSSVRFAAMYDTCRSTIPGQEFHTLSRYIDQKLVSRMDFVGLFKKYDKMMCNVMDTGKETPLSKRFIKLTDKYKMEGFLFNEIVVPKFKPFKPQKPQKFDPANLF